MDMRPEPDADRAPERPSSETGGAVPAVRPVDASHAEDDSAPEAGLDASLLDAMERELVGDLSSEGRGRWFESNRVRHLLRHNFRNMQKMGEERAGGSRQRIKDSAEFLLPFNMPRADKLRHRLRLEQQSLSGGP